jgi:hypothetical protein
MTTVQPMASAMNLTAPAPTFMNKLRAGNRPTLFKVGICDRDTHRHRDVYARW